MSTKRLVKLAHADTVRTYTEIQAADGRQLPVDPERVVESVEVDFSAVFRALRDSLPGGVVWGRGLGYTDEAVFLSSKNIEVLQAAYTRWLEDLVDAEAHGNASNGPILIMSPNEIAKLKKPSVGPCSWEMGEDDVLSFWRYNRNAEWVCALRVKVVAP
jgi:hypothetical protein